MSCLIVLGSSHHDRVIFCLGLACPKPYSSSNLQFILTLTIVFAAEFEIFDIVSRDFMYSRLSFVQKRYLFIF